MSVNWFVWVVLIELFLSSKFFWNIESEKNNLKFKKKIKGGNLSTNLNYFTNFPQHLLRENFESFILLLEMHLSQKWLAIDFVVSYMSSANFSLFSPVCCSFSITIRRIIIRILFAITRSTSLRTKCTRKSVFTMYTHLCKQWSEKKIVTPYRFFSYYYTY